MDETKVEKLVELSVDQKVEHLGETLAAWKEIQKVDWMEFRWGNWKVVLLAKRKVERLETLSAAQMARRRVVVMGRKKVGCSEILSVESLAVALATTMAVKKEMKSVEWWVGGLAARKAGWLVDSRVVRLVDW